MRALRALLLSAIATALFFDPTVARAGDELPHYGVAVWNEKGTFIASKWPGVDSFVLGSGKDSLIELPGLDERHAEFRIAPGEFKVIPVGVVMIDGDQAFTTRRVFPGQEIRLGGYKVKLFLNASDDPAQSSDQEKTSEEAVGAGDALTPVDPVSAGELAVDARKPEFGDKTYLFCHDPEFGKEGTEGVDFCAIFDESSEEVCPEAKKHCAEWRHAPLMCMADDKKAPSKNAGDDEDDEDDATTEGDPSAKNGERVDAREGVCPGGNQPGQPPTGKSRIVRRESRSPPLNIHLPPIVGWILIGALIAVALLWFLKSLRDAGWESKDVKLDESTVLSEAERNLQALPEARSNVLLKLAERAVARGDSVEAALLVHLAMLRFLDDEGLARYHPSKTNGDYQRAIRRHKPLASLFRSAANQTERIRFGDGQVDADRVRANIQDAERLLVKGTGETAAQPSEAAGGAAAGAVIALLALALTNTACQPAETTDPAFHSKEPTGMSALPVLLREAGMKVTIGRSKHAEIAPDVGVVVVRSSATTRGRWPQDLKVDALLDRDISVVVIDDLWQSKWFMPVTSSISHSRGATELALTVPQQNMFCEWRLNGLSVAVGDATMKLPYGRRLLWNQSTRTATAAVVSTPLELHPFLVYAGEPLIAGNPAGVAWAGERVEGGTSLSGCMYLFSDRDLFTNASLTRAANARFVAAFFAALTRDARGIMIMDRLDTIAFASSSGEDKEKDKDEDKPNPAKPLKASNMLPFIAQAMVALIALYIMLGAAFGPLRDPEVREHKAFIEHVEAIGRQYARTGIMGLTHSARSLARLVVMRYRDQVRGGTSGGWSAVAQHLAQKSELDEKDVRAALRLGIDGTSELGAPGADDPSPSSERMLRALSRLLGSGTKTSRKKK